MSGSRSASGGVTSVPVMGLYFMKSQKKTAKDYVQDGLVAMWDGIENAGWKTHDPAATTWIDLVNRLELAAYSGTAVFGDTYITCSANMELRGLAGAIASHGYAECGDDTLGTSVEMVADLGHMGEGAYGVGAVWWVGENGLSSYPGYYVGARAFYSLSMLRMLAGGMGNYEIQTDNYRNLGYVGTTMSDTLGRESRGRCYIDGNNIATTAYTRSQMYDRFANDLRGRVFGDNAICSFSLSSGARVMRLSVYDHVLTADEIAHNCAIDKVRFNLP